MMQTKHCAIFIGMTIALGCAVPVAGQEKQLKKSDLPAAVQKAAAEQSKGSTVKGYSQEKEGGQMQYEVSLLVNGYSKDITMDAQGNVMEIEEEVDIKAVPPEVRNGLQKQAGDGRIGKVESLTKRGTLVAYEAQVNKGVKHSEVQVGPDGKGLNHKE
jgi:hypothetical protein